MRFPRFIWLSVVGIALVACSPQQADHASAPDNSQHAADVKSKKALAQRSITDIDDVLNAASPSAAKYLPEPLTEVRRQLTNMKSSFEARDYEGVMKSAPWVMGQAQRLASAAATASHEIAGTPFPPGVTPPDPYARPVGDANDAFAAGQFREACYMFKALSEVGSVYATNRLQARECVISLAEKMPLSDKGETEYLMAKTIWNLPDGDAKSEIHLERAVKEGSGEAAFALSERNISEREKWLAIAVRLKDADAIAIMADRKQHAVDAVAEAHARYVDTLRAKYDERITYSSPEAEQVIRDFDIDCHAPDGRVLPLLNVFYAKMKEMDGADFWMTVRVDKRGDETRIYDVGNTKRGVSAEQLSFELNKWGELSSIGARPAAILNACFGTYGPIWVNSRRAA